MTGGLRRCLPGVLGVLGVAAVAPSYADAAHRADPRAVALLKFESHDDGRCQILSDGGKLRVMRNTGADRPIRYRLMRTFAGKPQGLAVGVADAGGADVKLGCTLVDGRPQDWTIERASFVTGQQ